MNTTLLLIGMSVITAALSWYAVKHLIAMLIQRNIVDTPNDRTLHHGIIPRGGGLAIIALLVLATLVVGFISGRVAMFFAISISLLAWSSLSWLDDQFDLSPRRRWLIQCVFAVLSVITFGAVDIIHLSSERYLVLPLLGAAFSVVGVLWLVNLYNFMDGMDGLAAAQTIIASATLSFWFWQYGDQGLAIICLVLAAASYGFLLWNWHPAKIFMGDVGSITIGAFFSTILLIAVSRYDFPVISFILLFAVFVADASVTILRRLFRREKIWLPHRSHYYQRLANMGFSHSKIVIGLIILMSISSLNASTTLIYRDTIPLSVFLEFILLLSCAFFVEYLESRNNHTTNNSS